MKDTLYVQVQVNFTNECRPLSCFVGDPVYCVCTIYAAQILDYSEIKNEKSVANNKDNDVNCNDNNNDIGYGNYNSCILTMI